MSRPRPASRRIRGASPDVSAAHLADLAVGSVLLAGLYATMAYGLGLIYGVLRVVNLAHGGAIMAGAYLGWVLHDLVGIDPYLAIPVVAAVSFALGVAMYQLLVRRLARGSAGGPASLLLLFGVWLVLRNIAYVLFTGNDQDLHISYATRSVSLLGVQVQLTRLVVLGVGLAIAVALHLLLRRTLIGRAIRAVAQNADSCTLVGIDAERIYALTFGIGTALAGTGGVLFATIFSFNPTTGSAELLRSFVVVVLGGLGSIYGMALAALIVAAVEQFSSLILPSYLTSAVGFVLLVLVLVLRPGGLFGHRVLS
jgi:branched-chain amino acid transport system permease protein